MSRCDIHPGLSAGQLSCHDTDMMDSLWQSMLLSHQCSPHVETELSATVLCPAARPNSQAGVAPAAQPSSAAPVDLSGSRRRLFNIPELAVHQEPATVEHAPHAMLGSNPGFAAVHAAPSAAVAAGAAPVIQELPHSTFSEPEEAEQYNLDDFVPELQQHRVDERNHDSDGSGTDDLRADTAQQAMPGELIKHGSSKSANSGSSKRQTFKGRTTSPHSSRKEPRKMYFEYAKQQWETEGVSYCVLIASR